MIVGPFGFVPEHTAFGPEKVSKELSEFLPTPTLDTIKQLMLKDQRARYNRTIAQGDRSISKFIHSNHM